MSTYNIGDYEGEWRLTKRRGKVELWHNTKSGYYGVYLYDRPDDDDWLLYSVRSNRDEAEDKFNRVASVVR